ncbi:MAG TPA: endo-1,4-beta-xylanase [Tepidisphaeraceae bacterium]|jgi:GH35 family endo-1,4-beta-xylanase|nr:endo-1,4-beta-xylanase [Tepidisphaeraceae bacterium]
MIRTFQWATVALVTAAAAMVGCRPEPAAPTEAKTAPTSTAPAVNGPATVVGQVPQMPAPPAGGASVAPALGQFQLGGSAANNARLVTETVSDQRFATAVRLTTTAKPANAWDIQLSGKTTAPIARGDALLVRFWGRAVQGQAETGEARSAIVVEKAGAPFGKSILKPLSLSAAWRPYQFGFAAAEDYPVAGAQVNFHAGFAPQAFEIAGLELLNYGKSITVDALPGSLTNYAGRATDAPWRQAAAERIDKHRKGDLTVTVVDAAGKPVPDATVAVRMTKHAFPFGSAVQARRIAGDSPEDARYRQAIAELFNVIVFENDLKWRDWEQPTRPAMVRKALDWLDAQGIAARGHVLVWPGWGSKMNAEWKYLPDDLKQLADAKPEGWQQKMRDRLDARVTDAVTALRGRLTEWDVINETWSNHAIMDLLGNQEMVRWFQLARAADPNVKLYYNDFTMLSGGAVEPDRIEHLYQTVKYLIDNGAPIDGIGEQGHFGDTVVEPERMLAILDRFATFGLPIRITEFDVNTADEKLQADYTRDFYTAAFSHPAVNGILMWGFWEPAHWMPNAAMYKADWTPKPSADAFVDLTRRQWWTSVDGTTDAAGSFATRAFYGNYELSATVAGKPPRVLPFSLAPGQEGSTRLVLD